MPSNPAKPQAFQTPTITRQELAALRAMEMGEATGFQQRLSLSVILKKLCRTYDVHFMPGQPDSSAFLEGRSFPGKKLIELLHLDPAQLVDLEDTNANQR